MQASTYQPPTPATAARANIDLEPGFSQQSSETLAKLVAPTIVPSTSPRASFVNWGKSFTSKPARVFAPKTIAHCAAIVELARRQGVQLRPIGRAHSPSDLALTKAWAMRMEGLKGLVSIDPATPSVTVLAGTYISDIHEALDTANPRLAMRSVGSISEQTIGGLISTATHGTGVDFPIVSAYVERLTILCPLAQGTTHLTCSRKELPDLFNATLCGLGTTGLITSVTLRVQMAFNLKQYTEEVPFDTLFGPKNGFPAAAFGSKFQGPIGQLVAHDKRLPPCCDEYLPSWKSEHPSQIHPLPPHAHAAAEELALSDPEDDEVTRTAQAKLEEVANSAQHVRLMWFPQAGMMTMLRANRSTERASPAPSLPVRLKASLINHRLTELLLYLARYNDRLTPSTVRWIHYLTHPSMPRREDGAFQAKSKVSAVTEAPAAAPRPVIVDESDAARSEQRFGSGHSGANELVRELEPGLAKAAEAGKVSWSTEELKGNAGNGPGSSGPGRAFAVDPPAPQPLAPEHPISAVVGRSDRIFNMDCLFPQYTDEWAIPLSRAAAAIRAMRDWFDEEEANSQGERLHFPVEIRFTDGDGVWLSHAQGRKTCYIGLVQYRPYNRPVRYRRLFAKFEALMRHYAGRPHWAKAHTCSPQELARLYPHWNDFLETRDRYDPERILVNPYVERHLLGKIGDQVDARVFKSRL
ncbi:D-arabinono-1,4-lactone oxidase [Thecaphora frezii]